MSEWHAELFRRHKRACIRGYSEYDKRDNCTCPLWVIGQIGDEFVRKATGTTSLGRVRKMIVAAEERGSWTDAQSAPSHTKLISDAIEEYLKEWADPKGKAVALPRSASDVSLAKTQTVKVSRARANQNADYLPGLAASTFWSSTIGPCHL